MRKKNTLAIISAVLMIFVWTGAALAINTATMNVTSEPIRYQAISDKGGGFTITFDAGTVLVGGDVITADLDLGATLARTIDLEISQGSATPFAAVPAQGTGSPFEYTGGIPTVTGVGVYFRVYGAMGTQRITISVMGTTADTVTAGPAAGLDSLILKFLNQGTIGAEYTAPNGLYAQFLTPGLYDTPATLAQNTLCINVSQFNENTVNANMDSADASTGGDKFTFVPSNPQIAHVVEALDINFVACKGALPGYIEIGDRITQGSEVCFAFDNETGSGYCAFTHAQNDAIVGSSSPFDLATYTVQLDILVNGQGGNNGVYWTNQLLGVNAATTNPGCGAGTTPIAGIYSYLNGIGVPVTAGPPNSFQCDVSQPPAPDQRAVTLISPQSNLGIMTGDDWLAFDFPALNYDLDEITAGDSVSIRVTITKVPCGSIFSGVWQIGVFGCLSAPAASGLLYPYFTEVGESSDAYWDGFVITNPAMTDATCLVTMFEADGDQGTITVTVPAMSQYVNLLSAMGFTHSAGTGTLGDSSCYIRVNATGASGIDGFGMMGRPDTGEAMGYLPRLMSF